MTTTDVEILLLESLEFAPVCEYLSGYKQLSCSNTATMVVVYKDRYKCGCPANPTSKYFCLPCWEYRAQLNYLCHIGGCGKTWKGTNIDIRRIEYL